MRPLRGHNSEVPGAILVLIELDLHLLMINIFRKFGVDRMKTFEVRARTTNFANANANTNANANGYADAIVTT